MPVTKNAIIRYLTLDKCFRNKGRRYTFADLLAAVNEALAEANPDASGILTRQLRLDIAFMKSTDGYSAPIEVRREGRNYYYVYSDMSFSINNQPINATECEQLAAAISMLSRFEGAPQFEWLSEIMPLLSNTFGLKHPDRKIISNETNIYYSGFDKITPIFNAIVNKRVLRIKYKPYTEATMMLVFHPHYIKQYNNRWFAFGYNASAERKYAHVADSWNLALDRIETIDELTEAYIENTRDWDDEYFSEIVGVTRNAGEVEEVKLWFSPAQAPYISSKSIHNSQLPPEIHPDGSISVRIRVVSNYELETLILGFGENVKVLTPLWLANKIKKRLIDAADLY